jgi:hypothetical protein
MRTSVRNIGPIGVPRLASRRYIGRMPREPEDVTTAADLDAMTPAERHADFESRVVDPHRLDHLPAQERAGVIRLMDRSRARLVERIARDEGESAAEDALRSIADSDGAQARERVEKLLAPGNAHAS